MERNQQDCVSTTTRNPSAAATVTSSADDVQFASACRIVRFESLPLPAATRILKYSQSWETTTSRLFRKSFSAGFFCDSVRQRSSFRSCEFPESSERGESVDSFYLTEQSPKSCCCCSRESSAHRAELVEQENPSIQTGFIGQSRERRRLCPTPSESTFTRLRLGSHPPKHHKNLYLSSVVKSYICALLRGAACLPQDNKSNVPKTGKKCP